MAWPASGNTTIALVPLATMPWMSEMAFWVLPWPSAYWKSVMFGHFATSALAEAVVTSRQLLPPKPSVSPRLALFGPHQDGRLPPAAALLLPPSPEPELPHPASRSAAVLMATTNGMYRLDRRMCR